MCLPGRLLNAVFNYKEYTAPAVCQHELYSVISVTFTTLDPLQQQILIQYYSGNFALRSLHGRLGISFNKLNRDFHLALHTLRLAANNRVIV